jgi:hypothetical protein
MRVTLVVPIVVLALAVIGASFVRHTGGTPDDVEKPPAPRG